METGRFADSGALAEMFAAQGATADRRIVNYCGGGISATLGFFAHRLLAYEDVALYDASMQEWAAAPDPPTARGCRPFPTPDGLTLRRRTAPHRRARPPP